MKDLEKPYILFDDIASLHESANAVYQLLECKKLYSIQYFDFIDYVIETPMVVTPT